MHQPFFSPRHIRWLAWAGTVALTLVPLAVLKAANPAAWAIEDLPFAFVMTAAVGVAAEVALRIPARLTRRAGELLALGTAFLLMWGNLAVGFAGSENNRVNALLFAVPAVALAGSWLAQFRPGGIATALAATAGAQLLAGIVLLAAGYFTGPLTVAFTGLWLVGALLFHRSARETATA